MNEISVARSESVVVLMARWEAFASWWLSGLREVLPSSWLGWIDGIATPKLLMRLEGDLVVCRLASAALSTEVRMHVHHFGPAAICAWLAECGLSRKQVIAGSVLDADLFYWRDFTLPKSALAALPRILEQDVLRRTPFQLSDIWHAAVPTAPAHELAGADVMAMRHWIIRRDRAEAALAKLGLSACDVDFLAAHEANAEPAPLIGFRTVGLKDPPWARKALKILAAAAVGVVILGIVAVDWCQSNVADKIEASLNEAREAASSIRGGQASRLFALKAEVGVLDIWDELSRVLPDHTFLTDIRINDRKIFISGFSADAARLVHLIDQSSTFTGAVLTAAITPDATERKDRFGISFRVRDGRAARPAYVEGVRHD